MSPISSDHESRVVAPYDRFFVEKIEQGLGGVDYLSATDRDILLTPVKLLHEAEIVYLNDTCVEALTVAYKQDTAGKNKDAALVWNQFNENLYKYSECCVSGIVQNWYLSEGRPLEKKVMALFNIGPSAAVSKAVRAARGEDPLDSGFGPSAAVKDVAIAAERAQQRELETEEQAEKEEELYAVAWQELEDKTFDKGLWIKLLAKNNGDESKARSEYLRERVKRLSTEWVSING